ncbi:MAG: nickel-responsive transcriptional regulator NikR [Helicobacter sp.]|uniref:nickel-responsive transcriptional regulator NikR n=1 Tax=Helicobacter sp. TaxID=218 RepID=UPI0025BC0EFC|nr:nickel-responsive transcriptional regulator NikR [Helicobacter sp.]MCH5313680.1 nickel-responsive transcriptional regulator NikR [Helicobacter sp.]
MKPHIIRFSVSLPKPLLETLVERLTHKGYSSRSEIVRDMIREKLNEEVWSSGAENTQGVAVLTIIYDHHQRELNQRIIDIQHNNTHKSNVEILCSTHVHLDHHNCLESIILRGKRSNIEDLSIEIGGLKGVKFSKLTRASAFE